VETSSSTFDIRHFRENGTYTRVHGSKTGINLAPDDDCGYGYHKKISCRQKKLSSRYKHHLRYFTMDIYPAFIHKGDLSPDSFGSDVDHICNEIQSACKGFGTDEK
jgi:hypothetical protein